MQDETNTPDPQTPARPARRRLGLGVGLLAAGAVAGGVLAGTFSASAADNTSGTSGSPTSVSGEAGALGGLGQQGGPGGQQGGPGGQQGGPGGHRGGPGGGGNMHGSAPVRNDEKALSDADAAKIKAAALEAVPGGTVYRVETDAGDGAYEAHMTKADGTEVTVKFDKNFAAIGTEDGMGKGDPAPAGQDGQGGPGGQAGPGSQTGAPATVTG